ncbi:MAG: class I SAM-dependent methyltransferase [Rhizomicrobium sp.]
MTTQDEQRALWNGPAGRGWIAAQGTLDQMYQPFEDFLAAAAQIAGGRVLDIGCGTGSTTRAAARGAAGHCLGVDISSAMIAAAQARAEQEGIPASFVCADAETYAFAPASFDLLMSRFGVMFFADPVRAFANLRRAARDGARLEIFAWRDAAENPFMTAAEQAAAPLLPRALSRRAPDAPGPFAFAEPGRVRAILEKSGWADIEIAPLDVECRFPESALVHYLTWMGPIGRILQEADAPTRAKVVDAVRAAFDIFVQGAEVRFNAACWKIDAHA